MLDEILKVYKEIISVENKIQKIVLEMQENSSEEMAKEYSKLQDRYELLNGYTYKKKFRTNRNIKIKTKTILTYLVT